MNAKLCKALRRVVRDSMERDTEKKRYVQFSLSKVIKLDKHTLDHAYKQLCAAYESRPEVREYVDKLIAYRRVLMARERRMKGLNLPPSG